MSFDGQVLCHRQVIGSWALAIVGRATVATDVAAAPLRNFLRVVAFIALSLVILPLSQLTGQRWPGCTKPPQANSEPHQAGPYSVPLHGCKRGPLCTPLQGRHCVWQCMLRLSGRGRTRETAAGTISTRGIPEDDDRSSGMAYVMTAMERTLMRIIRPEAHRIMP